MGRYCDLCGRGPRTIIKRTYSHKGIKTRQFLNLQQLTIKGKKIKICTRCLRKLYKEGKVQ